MKLMLIDIFYSNNKKMKVVNKKCEFGDIIYVYFNEKFLYKLNKSLYKRLFSLYFKIKVLKDNDYIYVLSKNMYKYNLNEFLGKFPNMKKIELPKNEIIKNSIKYLENENINSHIVIVTNNISREILNQYIDNFKHVSIYTNSSICFNLVKDLVFIIEQEKGTLVDIIYETKDENIIECDILMYLEDIYISRKIKYKKVYVLTQNVLDKYSDEYILFHKYKHELNEIDSYSYRELATSVSYLHNLNVNN